MDKHQSNGLPPVAGSIDHKKGVSHPKQHSKHPKQGNTKTIRGKKLDFSFLEGFETEDDSDGCVNTIGNHVYFYDSVSTKSLMALILGLERAKAHAFAHIEDPFIVIHIHSDGGDLHAGLCAYDRIRLLTDEIFVRTVIEGSVSSAATLIALGANEVHMLPNSFFLIHQLSLQMSTAKFEDLKDEFETSEGLMTTIKNIYTSRTNMTFDNVSKLISRERPLTAKMCLEYGIVDHILYPLDGM